jgi:hypothetical protein
VVDYWITKIYRFLRKGVEDRGQGKSKQASEKVMKRASTSADPEGDRSLQAFKGRPFLDKQA